MNISNDDVKSAVDILVWLTSMPAFLICLSILFVMVGMNLLESFGYLDVNNKRLSFIFKYAVILLSFVFIPIILCWLSIMSFMLCMRYC